jgi:hypothetical protein
MDDIVCEKCQNIKEPHQFPCVICKRLMCYNNCKICDGTPKSLFDACSPKCKQILNGEGHIIPIQHNHANVIIIEDFGEYMGLKVVDHFVLNQILTEQQKNKLDKNCDNCKTNKYTLLPYKCWSCKDVYTYEVECVTCYNKNGYLCDECDYQLNGEN